MRSVFNATLAALLGAALWLAPAAHAAPLGSVGLAKARQAFAPELAANAFGEPLLVRSVEGPHQVAGHAYAVLDLPFAQVSQLLADRAQWCAMLMLHLNNKYCREGGPGGVPHIELYVGRKSEQPVRSATRLNFAWVTAVARADYAVAELAAPDGPYDTRDYALVVEAIPGEGGRTFLHMGYSFSYGGASHLAMHFYLATVGRDKVGFSVERESPGAEPRPVGGMRGVAERNVMRYLLALRCHAVAPASALEDRLACWFDATERYARQLHEVERADYVAMKRAEYRRLAETP
ncbi:hypothetical protein [Caenimonas aquaedulcis]|uniref:Uncharacterized protein n=1 Tax=Caenimonas aquaedulcis TaxID=2793270 RepID=A0A931H8E0_9BURK|nr:hypothetical protein [Caenimonas aquaedulcis]MBG9390225.1 hypothetical protein [Caenimonas aquaedulcis]